jgi:hypothetical protein
MSSNQEYVIDWLIQTMNVAITGANTHFNAGSAASFGPGITVGLLNVTDATHATAPISIG